MELSPSFVPPRNARRCVLVLGSSFNWFSGGEEGRWLMRFVRCGLNRFEYLWQDGNHYKKPTKLSAPGSFWLVVDLGEE